MNVFILGCAVALPVGIIIGMYIVYYLISAEFGGNLNRVIYCYKNGLIKLTDKY